MPRLRQTAPLGFRWTCLRREMSCIFRSHRDSQKPTLLKHEDRMDIHSAPLSERGGRCLAQRVQREVFERAFPNRCWLPWEDPVKLRLLCLWTTHRSDGEGNGERCRALDGTNRWELCRVNGRSGSRNFSLKCLLINRDCLIGLDALYCMDGVVRTKMCCTHY